LHEDDDLAAANAALSVRIATYTTDDPGTDALRLATENDVDVVLLDAAPELLEGGQLDQDLAVVLERAPCDVAVLVGGGELATGPLVAPFGGAEHDWSAIEVAAWLARSLGTTLRLLGTEAIPAVDRRDASRLLSRASMLVQQVVGIVTEPVLIRPGDEGVVRRRATPACSSSACPTGGEPKASATCGSASQGASRHRRSSCDAASGPAESHRARR
jgi:hypothetical protein